ncbi:uncharacterized protein LOC124296786 [Neodiprion virginianus]|uniref:uncharacterized protein LOC124174509 n=1 Tax=Neodiprion fabricii TaxID=2872261 RepID=UPI001ED8C9CB|nr:uncharacterized protein LOC124174509 [Neodiprion fabricii]XP_046603095.1 uncharacterized protein LOC124296786 [Neodiprion virginianus]
MRRMRMRSVGPNFTPGSSTGTSGRVGGGGESGVGGSGNHSEARRGVKDRWRMLYYQIRVSQQNNQKRTTAWTGCGKYKLRTIEMGSLNPMKWKIRTFASIVATLFVIYVFLIFKKTHYASFDAIIKDTKPDVVWEFVADFSNMKKLNPTIEDIQIVVENGNYDHWKYSAKYLEHLSHVPMIRNQALGHFAIIPGVDSFIINSEHRTCFLGNWGCLDSISEFKFLRDGQNTKCVETVQYECPIALSILCRKEVMYQRHEIMKNLKLHFATVNIKAQNEK